MAVTRTVGSDDEGNEMGRVEDKVVLVTGVARGQGREHAVRLAEEGAHIVGIDIAEDIATNDYPMAGPADLEETGRLVEKADRRVALRRADVRDRTALRAAVSDAVAEVGGTLHGVIAQAGIAPLGRPAADTQAFVDALSVDYLGVVNTVDAALPFLADGGSIVCTGSLAGLITGSVDNPSNGPGGAGYSLAKRQVAQLVHDLARITAPRRIRVNAIHPTNCNTDMLHSDVMYRQFRPDLENPTRADAEAAFPAMSAMGVPWVEPSDIAAAGLFLISDESRFVTGVQLRVDAGAYVRMRPQQPTF